MKRKPSRLWILVLLISIAINAGALYIVAGYRNQVDNLLVQVADKPDCGQMLYARYEAP